MRQDIRQGGAARGTGYDRKMADPRHIHIKVQLYCGDEIAMGPGKADLLDAIRAHGSISAAGRALGMSYRRAWLLVDAMNRCWRERLVETSPGGGRSGGAQVTAAGDAVLAIYRRMQSVVTDGAEGKSGQLFDMLRDTPLPIKASPD